MSFVSESLNSTVHSSETAICMNKQGVVDLYVPLFVKSSFSISLKRDQNKQTKLLFYNSN